MFKKKLKNWSNADFKKECDNLTRPPIMFVFKLTKKPVILFGRRLNDKSGDMPIRYAYADDLLTGEFIGRKSTVSEFKKQFRLMTTVERIKYALN